MVIQMNRIHLLEQKFNMLYDKYNNSTKIKISLFIILLIGFYINIFTLNKHSTFVADDYGFYLTAQSFKSIHDFFAALYQMYLNWGGRMIGTGMTYILLLFSKNTFDIINTIGYICLVLLIYFNIAGKRKIYISLLIYINFFLYAFLPAFGQDLLWISGSGNYLWTALIALAYTLFWRCFSQNKERLYNNPIFIVFFTILGILAGWTNENTAIALFVMAVAFIIYYKKYYHTTYTFSVFAALGELIGAILQLTAPGNFVRVKTAHITLFANLRHNFDALFNFDCLLVPLLIFCILYLVINHSDKIIALIFAFAAFTSVMALTPSQAYFTGRVVLSGLAFMMIAAGILYINIDFTNYKIKQIIAVLSVFIAISSLSIYNSAKADILDYEHDYNTNIQIIDKEKASGNKDITINNIFPKSRFCASYGLDEITTNPMYWTNTSAAAYFGVEHIKATYVK